MMRTFRERGGEVVVAGDGRADSPGHCAKYGVYSLIDMNSGQVIGLHIVQSCILHFQSNEVKLSYNIDLEGLKRAVSALNGAGINILEIITDRHMQIQKWIRENMPFTVHSFDVWHIAKGVKKKLLSLAKEKDCQDVSRWIKSITNHLYWTAASCNKGDSDLMESKWKSVSSHVQNIHHGHQGPYKECQHDLLQDRVWLKPGKLAFLYNYYYLQLTL
ncbi:uncharacterized protein LOC132726451 [Ruditapes philippinarum]|uniref:uncharacterized protein LOC132726451 n=1 Tax=Ruditapes philippinarum TaxID=129788 RepID=UPI00295B9C08|nr:uncharacterized protein LOC132726451 [Ruditapes philippinarum]